MEIVIFPKASKQLARLDRPTQRRIDEAILKLADNLNGDVKRLTNHDPNYRLRVGDFRVLFNLEGQRLMIHRIVNRRDAY